MLCKFAVCCPTWSNQDIGQPAQAVFQRHAPWGNEGRRGSSLRLKGRQQRCFLSLWLCRPVFGNPWGLVSRSTSLIARSLDVAVANVVRRGQWWCWAAATYTRWSRFSRWADKNDGGGRRRRKRKRRRKQREQKPERLRQEMNEKRRDETAISPSPAVSGHLNRHYHGTFNNRNALATQTFFSSRSRTFRATLSFRFYALQSIQSGTQG